jgi:hypothetical protein
MAIKRSTRATRAATPIVEIIVRRRALRRFHKLKQATVDLPAVEVSWDRRMSEHPLSSKGVEPEHRRVERRQKPPFTWDVADFVVVERSSTTSVADSDQ